MVTCSKRAIITECRVTQCSPIKPPCVLCGAKFSDNNGYCLARNVGYALETTTTTFDLFQLLFMDQKILYAIKKMEVGESTP